jgi:hypothetical protein
MNTMTVSVGHRPADVNDYCPRLAANEAARDIEHVIRYHPEVTVERGEALMAALAILKELRDE